MPIRLILPKRRSSALHIRHSENQPVTREYEIPSFKVLLELKNIAGTNIAPAYACPSCRCPVKIPNRGKKFCLAGISAGKNRLLFALKSALLSSITWKIGDYGIRDSIRLKYCLNGRIYTGQYCRNKHCACKRNADDRFKRKHKERFNRNLELRVGEPAQEINHKGKYILR